MQTNYITPLSCLAHAIFSAKLILSLTSHIQDDEFNNNYTVTEHILHNYLV